MTSPSNHPEGFAGFQSRMEQMEEQLGGDWLASRTVEQYWAEGIDAAMRRRQRRHEAVGLAYRAHHRGGWVRASDAEWAEAVAEAEARLPAVEPGAVIATAEREGQTFALTERALYRLGRDPEGPALLLARARASHDPMRTEAEVALSDSGLALIEHLQFKRVRSKFRRCSRAGIGKTLRAFADAMGVTFTAAPGVPV